MAGRFVVLSFDSRDSAEAFVSHTKALEYDGAELVAMFMKPEQFCECPTKRRQNVANWAKGKRTGLYLCRVCKKPSVHHQQGILTRLQYVFGYNLLDKG